MTRRRREYRVPPRCPRQRNRTGYDGRPRSRSPRLVRSLQNAATCSPASSSTRSPVDGADQRADLSAQDPVQRGPAGKDRSHPNPSCRQRGRHLATDEPHADHDRAPARRRLLLDRVALGHRAQIVDPGQLGPANPEPPVTRSGGYEDLLVADLLARAEDDRMRGRIDAATLALRTSTPCSAYQPAGLTYQPSRSSSDRRYVLDSGGRPNGTPGSRLTITTGPAKPSSRRVAAALPPASPLPTITIELPPLLSDTRHRPGCSFLSGKRVLALGSVAVGLYSFTVAWILARFLPAISAGRNPWVSQPCERHHGRWNRNSITNRTFWPCGMAIP